MLRFSDARNFGRTLTGLALIAGPLLMLVASIVTPSTDNDNKLKELNSVAAHKSAYLWGSVLFLLGTLILLAASVGIGRQFTSDIAGTLLLDWRRAIVAGRDDALELVGIVQWRLARTLTVSPYLFVGLTDGSPDVGLGIEVSWKFGRY